MHNCPGCQKFQLHQNSWCESCINRLVGISDLTYGVITPFAYEEPLKTALILYKLTGSRVFERALCEALASAEEAWQPWVEWCDQIIFAPQSISSFLELKSNAAMLIANFMSKKYHKANRQGKFQFSLKKQTSKKRISCHHELISLAQRPGHRNLLIVDDVLSSGQTLLRMSKYLPKDNLKFFCLMRSRAINA
jgi:predicted amidophosphoribosyltransferase